MKTMKAVVLTGTCAASELKVSTVSIPQTRSGWVLVRIIAFGLNHSESILRDSEADAPYITLPLIPGIECAGIIEDPSDTSFRRGQKVIALMGGMGRSFNGSYAEYALLPSAIVFAVDTDLDYQELAAIPETYVTAYVSLFESLQIAPGDTLLIRGGTSAAGLAAIQLAKTVGCTVLATTRYPSKLPILQKAGADYPLVDEATLENAIHDIAPQGVDKVMELVGPATLLESMRFVKYHGVICSTGILGNRYTLDDFDPIKDIPRGVYLSSCYTNSPTKEAIDSIFSLIAKHHLHPVISSVLPLEKIAEAHALLESSTANGKIVITVSDQALQ